MADRSFGVALVITEKGIALVDKAGKEIEIFGNKTEATSVKTVALGVTLGNLATKGFEVAGRAIKGAIGLAGDFIAESNKQEDAVDALNDALAANGGDVAGLSAEYQALANSFQETSKHASEDLLPQMGKLISVGNVQRDQMEASTRAALQLAAGMGGDLNGAFETVAKAAADGKLPASLSKLGIHFKDTGDKTRNYEAILKEINARFGGMENADTFSDQLDQLGNAMADMKDDAGDVITLAITPLTNALAAGIPTIQTFIEAHKDDAVRGLTAALSGLVTGMDAVIGAGVSVIGVYGQARAVFGEMLLGLQPVIDKMAKMADFVGWDSMAQDLRDLSSGLQANAVDQADFSSEMDVLAGKVRTASAALRENLTTALETVGTTGQDVAAPGVDAVKSSVEGLLNVIVPSVDIMRGHTRTTEEDAKASRNAAKGKDEHALSANSARKHFADLAAAEAAGRKVTEDAAKARELATTGINGMALALEGLAAVQRKVGGRGTVELDEGGLSNVIRQLEAARGRAGGIAGGRDMIDAAIASARAGDVGGVRDIAEAAGANADFARRSGGAGSNVTGLETLKQSLLEAVRGLNMATLRPHAPGVDEALARAQVDAQNRTNQLLEASLSAWGSPVAVTRTVTNLQSRGFGA